MDGVFVVADGAYRGAMRVIVLTNPAAGPNSDPSPDKIRSALAGLYRKQALIVEPSAAITVAFVQAEKEKLDEPVCVILTGGNITREDFDRLIAESV